MMKQLAIMAFAALAASASAQEVNIQRNAYGSGTPGSEGFENADVVENNIYHSPQYMAAFPTAGTIWPRVVEVPCVRIGTSVSATYNKQTGEVIGVAGQPKLKCDGYQWTPKMGRGEYLFFKPVIVEPVRPEIVRERTIIKEVAPKKLKE